LTGVDYLTGTSAAELNRGKLPIITCKCGVEFLLIPDLDEMSLVVEKHAQMHREAESDPEKAEAVYDEIQDHLIMQIFAKIRQIK
jgi:hypothetical protein